MNKQTFQPPILRAFRSFSQQAQSTKFFYILIAALYIIVIFMFFSPRIQQMFMRKMHLSSSNFLTWAATQTVPSMYNFSNEVWVTDDEGGQQHFWMNHFPLRFLSFSLHQRKEFFDTQRPFEIILKSTYRNHSHVTEYLLITERGQLEIIGNNE